tara:strand:+ start:599 stop:1678 length:1080 start_codon:yes stop_codon:yes gene_type:complete
MKINKIFDYTKSVYIFFSFLSLIIFFFSTTKVNSKVFEIDNVEISRPFEIEFNKNQVIDEGFEKAFQKLIKLIVNSSDLKKIKAIKQKEIKAMIDSFSIKEEKFINEIYYVNLGVSFNKKKIFKYLELKNIFPSIPNTKNFLFIPVIIEENKKDLFIFSNNSVYEKWNETFEDYHLIKYILPTEDLEDLDIIKKKYETIEQYDFKEIVNKYYLQDSIISLIFTKNNQIRTLSRITIKNNVFLKNRSFKNFNLDNEQHVAEIIKELKNDFEDYWKNSNQINTSIKLPINIKLDSSDSVKIANLEKTLEEKDLIYDYFITKFDKDFIIYEIIFNGTPDLFIKSMEEKNFNLDTQNKVWLLK